MEAETMSVCSLLYLHGLTQHQGPGILRKCLLHELMSDGCSGKYGEGVKVAQWLGRQRTPL